MASYKAAIVRPGIIQLNVDVVAKRAVSASGAGA